MNQGLVNTVVSAIVGGIVGAGVVFFAGNAKEQDLKNVEMQELKVAKVTVTDQLTLLNKEGNPEVVIKDGSILLENVLLAKKVVAKQMQGHALVANRVFATPDDVFATPMENWRFYAELGSSLEEGGEIVVRSVQGPNLIGRPISGGSLFRLGYDPEQRPQMLAMYNPTRSQIAISQELSETQRQQLLSAAAANQQVMAQPGMAQPGNYNSNAAAPVYQNPATIVASPDPNAMR